MSSPTKTKEPLGERSANISSPVQSPSKVPLPLSPIKASSKQNAASTFCEETGPMDPMFKALTLSQKPELVRKISQAHSAGQTYVSPSDDILSPATKKLSEVKGRRFGNFKKSTSLYKAHNIFAKSAKTSGHEERVIDQDA